MENKDEYLVYTRNDRTRFYYKNKKLHREAGPAVVIYEEYNKYLNLGDENLYKRTTESVEKTNSDDFLVECLPNGNFVVLKDPPIYYLTSYYYLNGIEYTEQEFNAIILKEKLCKELAEKDKEEKIVKV
jgi:hypothetical protein